MKWKTENIPATHNVDIYLAQKTLNGFVTSKLVTSLNDGKETIVLPVDITGSPLFMIYIQSYSLNPSEHTGGAYSDNSFTINALTPTQQGDVNGDGSINCTDVTWIQETVLNTRTLTTTQRARADVNGDGTVSTLDAVLLSQTFGLNCSTATPSITVLSPNGGEVYTEGQQVMVRWKTENVPVNQLVSISLDYTPNNSNWGIGLLPNNTINDGVEVVTITTKPHLNYGNF